MLKNIVTLKSRLGATHRANLFIHNLYVAEIYRPGAIFLPQML